MSKEKTFDEMVEGGAFEIISILKAAITIGDYKKANEILDFFSVEKSDNSKVKEDVMVA